MPEFTKTSFASVNGYYSGTLERRFFERNTPLPTQEVDRAIAITHHAIVPAVLTGDIEAFRQALSEMHRCGFKKRELDGQSDTVKSLYFALNDIPNCAVGLSSMGPLLYVVYDRSNVAVPSAVADRALRFESHILSICSGRNAGFEIAK